MVGGARSAASRLRNLVREERNRLALSGEGQPTASQRWLGRSPEGPGAEPLGNDRTPLFLNLVYPSVLERSLIFARTRMDACRRKRFTIR